MDLGGRKDVSLVERQRGTDRRKIESLVTKEVDLAQRPLVSRGDARGPHGQQDQCHNSTEGGLHRFVVPLIWASASAKRLFTSASVVVGSLL